MLGIAIADEPSSRIRYDRRATSPAVVAFQPQGNAVTPNPCQNMPSR